MTGDSAGRLTANVPSVSRPHLDVLAEEVGIETQPVSGNVEAALQEDVSEQSAGVHWETQNNNKTTKQRQTALLKHTHTPNTEPPPAEF